MSNRITPDECFVLERSLYVQTRCLKENVTDEMVQHRASAANLAAGDSVRVQCMDHQRTTVLHQRDYLVYSRTSAMQRDEINDRDIRQYEKISYGVEPVTDWITTRAGKAKEAERKEAAKDAAQEPAAAKPKTKAA